MAASTNPWTARLRPASDTRLRLICFAHAGGGAATFRGFAQHLPDDIDLCAIRLPGRESRLREPPVRKMGELVGLLGEALEDLFDVPFGLFGYCSGALTAFELARYLRENGGPQPAALFACACPSPAMVLRDSGVHELSKDELTEHLAALGIIPDTILRTPGLLDMFEPSVRADYEVYETHEYVPDEPLDIPVSVYGATADPSTTEPTLLGWREETTRTFSMRLFPGDHGFFEDDRAALAAGVSTELRTAAAQTQVAAR
ncbi:thioesterase II family protein [Streptomyces iconiensis]|uniref:Thioesterase domain-containing protein n=1 Tax=Streptomyces iconiensis TaxID=1384038 RepID=A0ABT7A3X4_9ACTN|nr:thioesterase domain-containing protein [Streptomyces iconiensis]MDJ1136015.1 thioesterase domain-containing protein [Streptomyces iconiensis]